MVTVTNFPLRHKRSQGHPVCMPLIVSNSEGAEMTRKAVIFLFADYLQPRVLLLKDRSVVVDVLKRL
jgi:hypothetical protein